MSDKTSSSQLPVYVEAGGIGNPIFTKNETGKPKGSPFASVTHTTMTPDQSSGPVVVTHAGLDVKRSANLGLKMFDQIKSFNLKVSPATEALMMGSLFHRLFELRNPQQTVMPPVPLMDKFVFPKNAAWHFVATDGIEMGPDPRDVRVRQTVKRTIVSNFQSLTSHVGNPIPLVFNLKSETDRWYRTTRAFKRSHDAVKEASNENLLPIVNYSWLTKMYRYTRSIYTERYRWENIWRTVLGNVYNYLEGGDTHTHFIFIEMPRTLMPLSVMRNLIGKSQQELLRKLQDEKQWMIYELWKWIDPTTRSESLFAVFNEAMLEKLRIVITDNGRFTVFNPASINRWTIDPNKPNREGSIVEATQMQRRFIRGLMSVMEHRNPIAEDSYSDDTSAPEELTTRTDPTATSLPIGGDINGEVTEDSADAPQEQEFSKTSAGDGTTIVEKAEMILQNMDDDLNTLEVINGTTVTAGVGDSELDASIDDINQQNQPAKTTFEEELSVTDTLNKRINKMADQGAISATEYRKLQRLIELSQVAPSGYDAEVSMAEAAAVLPADTELGQKSVMPDRDTVSDKSMLKSTLEDFDSKYVKNVLKRDIASMLLQAQMGGAVITKHTVEVVEDAMGGYEYHSVSYQPLEGQASILRFKIPIVSPSGRVKSGGSEQILRKQRVDLPIVKVGPSRVSLSSYYNKHSISLNERSAYNYDTWLQKELALKTVGATPTITEAHTGNSFDHRADAPRSYSALSHVYRSFMFDGITFAFDKKIRATLFKPEIYEVLGQDGIWPIGRKGDVVYGVDKFNTMYSCKPGEHTPLDSIERFFDFGTNKPIEHCVARIFAKDIPVGLMLGYYYGFTEVIKMLGIQVRRVFVGTRQNLAPDEWSLVFEDQAIVFNRNDQLATLIFGGLKQYEKGLRLYSAYAFDRPEVYFNIVEYMGLTGRFIRMFDDMRNMFVDPITKRVLIKMGEPTTYPALIKRACEMLLTSQHPDKMDLRYMRIRGTERIAGAIYNEITKSIREHNAKSNKATAKIDLHPFDVWNAVMRDTAMTQVKDINPINALKEREAVTFSGEGGRQAQTMMRGDRVYHPSDMGVISEASPDSGDVGVSTYLVGVPRFANMEGMIEEPQFANTDPSSLMSTSAQVSVSSIKDDPKRVNFVSVQHGHGVACDNYVINPVLTGYESTIADRVESNYAVSAKQAGKVVSVNPNGVIVEYADGKREGFQIGRRYGNSAGMTFPHDLVANVKVGEAFKPGDVLLYHKGFFKPDTFDKTKVHWMNGTMARVALLESRKTHEDACSVTRTFGNDLKMEVTSVKKIVVSFSNQIRNLAKIGDTIEYGQPLCFIEDEVTSSTDIFTEDTINTLRYFSGQTPTAKVSGRIDNIEVYYHGHPDDMSSSLQEITGSSDYRMSKARRGAGKNEINGAVDENFGINGEPLLMDNAVIMVYITHQLGAGVGDKIVVGNQLKSVVSEVMDYEVATEDGTPVDVIFGAQSVFNRIVGAPFDTLFVTNFLDALSKKASKLYFGK